MHLTQLHLAVADNEVDTESDTTPSERAARFKRKKPEDDIAALMSFLRDTQERELAAKVEAQTRELEAKAASEKRMQDFMLQLISEFKQQNSSSK